ncbi:oxidoreductase [Sporichthya brevicatena]|uniref:Oxidoreductase n=1 Tax=Sporichthya brevicatena TaxID=171442 RepID=A0ABP3S8T4_9ACTN
MNPIAFGLLLAGGAALAGALAGVVAPAKVRAAAVGVLTALTGVGGVVAGVAALDGERWSDELTGVIPLAPAPVAVDALSGVFLLLIGAVAVAAGLYSIGYGDPSHSDDRGVVLPLFVAAMLAVPVAASVTTLLLAWELMALTSLILVLTDHRRRPEVAEAGIWYAVMTQAGFLAVLAGLAVFASSVGGEAFTDLRAGAGDLGDGTRGLIFVLVLIGFGSKAGMVPLHVWLPRAHPEAPSHVSALMSAAMVKLGLYGLLRVWFDLLGGGPRWWGVVVLVVGAVSALYGALQASVATDLKALLAHSTSEHLGLMLLGVGAAGMLAAEGKGALAGLLVAAAVLHALNHAGFKTLLFLGAGSVLRATGLRNLDAMGGLIGRMPVTAALVAVGVVCAAALPPGNGFVSEWLLIQGLVHAIGPEGEGSVAVAVSMPLAVGVVALTAGLGAIAFVKAFGVGFLARPRSEAAAAATESPAAMRLGMGLAAAVCVALALGPMLLTHALARVVEALPALGADDPVRRDGVGLELAAVPGSMSPFVLAVALTSITVGLVFSLARRRTRNRRAVPIWGCGGVHLDPRMEYTATSFAEPLTRVFDDVLGPQSDLAMTPYAESRYLIESAQYRREVPDRLEARLYPPLIAATSWWGERARAVANGSVHRYLAYGFLGVVAVIVVIGVLG